MNLEELKAASPAFAESALLEFGDKSSHMTFLPKENGCAAFTQSQNWFLWYWLDGTTMKWRDTHMLKDENWLFQEG